MEKKLIAALILLLSLPVFAAQDQYQRAERIQVTLSVRKNSAIVMRNGVEVIRVPLKPKKRVQQIIEDRVFLVANCLIVARQVIRTEGIDGYPRPAYVEIFTLDGKRQAYYGEDVERYDFLGYSFTHPSGEWGVILHEGDGAEGEVSGYLFMRSDGSFRKHNLGQLLLLPSGKITTTFSNEGDLVIPGFRRRDEVVSLVIKPSGSFVIK